MASSFGDIKNVSQDSPTLQVVDCDFSSQELFCIAKLFQYVSTTFVTNTCCTLFQCVCKYLSESFVIQTQVFLSFETSKYIAIIGMCPTIRRTKSIYNKSFLFAKMLRMAKKNWSTSSQQLMTFSEKISFDKYYLLALIIGLFHVDICAGILKGN